MRREEFEKAIKFKSLPLGHNKTQWEAVVGFHHFLTCDNNERITEEEIRKHLTEQLYRHIFDWDKQKLYRAIMELRSCSPLDYATIEEAVSHVLEAASERPPS